MLGVNEVEKKLRGEYDLFLYSYMLSQLGERTESQGPAKERHNSSFRFPLLKGPSHRERRPLRLSADVDLTVAQLVKGSLDSLRDLMRYRRSKKLGYALS